MEIKEETIDNILNIVLGIYLVIKPAHRIYISAGIIKLKFLRSSCRKSNQVKVY